MKHFKKLTNKLRTLWNYEPRLVSSLCGGGITIKDTALACIGCAAVASLVVACVFLIAVIYVPYC